ncbi:hypothetical protein D3C72_446290 [compost metagenome]
MVGVGQPEGARHLVGGLEAVLGALGEEPHDGGVEVRAHLRRQPARRRRGHLEVHAQGVAGRGALERQPARQPAEGGHAEGVEVRALVGLAALNQLGGQVGDGALDAVRPGAGRAGEPEVHQLEPALGRLHEVAGFQVAMDQPAAVQVIEHGQKLGQQRAHGVGRQLARALERLAFDELHGEEGQPVGREALAVDPRHARVVQGGHHAVLGLEAALGLEVPAQGRGHHLDRDHPVRVLIMGPVDRGHAPGPQRGEELVTGSDQGSRLHVRFLSVPTPGRAPIWRRGAPVKLAI